MLNIPNFSRLLIGEFMDYEKLIYLDARTDEKFVSLMTSEAAKEITDDISVSVSVDSKDIFIFDLDGNRLK